jgi:hypothetical protein
MHLIDELHRELTEQAGWGVPHTLVLRREAETRSTVVRAGLLGVTLELVAPGDTALETASVSARDPRQTRRQPGLVLGVQQILRGR